MKYLGLFSSEELAKMNQKYLTLLTYTKRGLEIIIYYDPQNPFISRKFAIKENLSINSNSYTLYEYTSARSGDDEVREEIALMAENILSSKESL